MIRSASYVNGMRRGRVWIARHRRVVVAIAILVWLFMAVVVGLATSGGVVWF